MFNNRRRRIERLEVRHGEKTYDVDLGGEVVRVTQSTIRAVLDEVLRNWRDLPDASEFLTSKPQT